MPPRETPCPTAIYDPVDPHAVVIECDELARAQGVVPGMPMRRALGTCPELELVDHDAARVAAAAELFLTRLEELGAGVQPLEPGRVLISITPLERLYGGREGVVARIREAFSPKAGVRIGLGPNRFMAEVAAWRAGHGGTLTIEAEQAAAVLAPIPIGVLGLPESQLRVWSALALRTLGDVARLEAAQVADRFGAPGLEAWRRAHGLDDRPFTPRTLREHVETGLTFPEATGSLVTLERAVRMLVERVLAQPEMDGYAPRHVVVTAHLVEGGSWVSSRTLRVPTIDAQRMSLTACTELEQIPAPVERLEVRLEHLVPHVAEQASFDALARQQRAAHLRDGISHVQTALGDEAMLAVLEVAPESRVPEHRAVLVAVDRHHVGRMARGGDRA